jgi:hypothetical protein
MGPESQALIFIKTCRDVNELASNLDGDGDDGHPAGRNARKIRFGSGPGSGIEAHAPQEQKMFHLFGAFWPVSTALLVSGGY